MAQAVGKSAPQKRTGALQKLALTRASELGAQTAPRLELLVRPLWFLIAQAMSPNRSAAATAPAALSHGCRQSQRETSLPNMGPERVSFIGCLFLICALSGCATKSEQSDQKSSVAIIEGDSNYEITVPQSRLILKIPEKGLKCSEGQPASASPRYFNLKNNGAGVNVSGWFEPTEQFPGNQTYWAHIERNWPKGVPAAQRVSFTKEGSWEVIWYYVVRETGTQQNAHASRVEAGTWIDLHISVFPFTPEQAQDILTFLKSIQVETKP